MHMDRSFHGERKMGTNPVHVVDPTIRQGEDRGRVVG